MRNILENALLFGIWAMVAGVVVWCCYEGREKPRWLWWLEPRDHGTEPQPPERANLPPWRRGQPSSRVQPWRPKP